MKTKKYYTLLESINGALFTPEFGDYEKDVVEDERDDMKARAELTDDGTHTEYKIIRTGETQTEIDNEIARINSALYTEQMENLREK